MAAATPLLVILGILGFGFDKNIAQFLREPMVTAQLHPLTGFVSSLGVLLWCTTSSICVFSGLLLRRHGGSSEAVGFLLSAGCLSGYLTLDDFFQIHEALASSYLGVSELYVYVALALAASWYLIRYRKLIFETDIRLLATAVAFLGVSVAIDAVFEPWLHGLGQGRIFLEDGAKWLGICAWCSYHVQTAYGLLAWSHSNAPAAKARPWSAPLHKRPAGPVC